MGIDVLTLSVGEVKAELVLNVLSLEAASLSPLPKVEDGLEWSDLLQAIVRYEPEGVSAEFPDAVMEKNGETVRISGFMTPLQADSLQTWFILTSSPPHCYFDIPGGPAGTLEVLAPDGVEVSWDPIVLEGRFETVTVGEGAVYRLHDAKLVQR